MKMSIPSVMCRLCGEHEESIVHLLSACPSLAATAYLYHHNLVAGVLHWYLMKANGFPLSSLAIVLSHHFGSVCGEREAN